MRKRAIIPFLKKHKPLTILILRDIVPGMNGDYLFPGAFLELPGMKPLLKDDLWLD